MSTRIAKSSRLRWSKEEVSVLFAAWEEFRSKSPTGYRQVFVRDVALTLFPHRSESAIVLMMRRNQLLSLAPQVGPRIRSTPIAISDVDGAYLAAMLDGEGSVRKIQPIGHNKGRSMVVQVVAVHNTDLGIISKVHSLLPGSTIGTTKQCPSKRDNGELPLFMVLVSGYDLLRQYIVAVLPHVAHSEKKRRLEVMAAFIEGKLRAD